MEATVFGDGEGEVYGAGPVRLRVLAQAPDHPIAVTDNAVPPGFPGPVRHRHARMTDVFYVLEGELAFHVDGRDIAAGAGSWVTLARGSLHHFKNVGDRPARMLIVVTPAGLERFFLEVGRAAGEGDGESRPSTPEDIEKLLAVAPQYGIEIRVPERA